MMKKSEINRIIKREEDRFAPSAPNSLHFSRRALLKSVATLAAATTISPWPIGVLSAFAQGTGPAAKQGPASDGDADRTTLTLEAYADTLIPGEKRFSDDVAIAGVVTGPGAVQGGAIDMMNFVGLGPTLPLLAPLIGAAALAYALLNRITLDPTLPPFVSLDFAQRTALMVQLLAPNAIGREVYSPLAALCFVAFNTAGYRDTVVAIEQGHPGLTAIGFPAPNPDGKWRFPDFSYQQVLAKPHPGSQDGNPA
jgi:enediyne biosynthesis protein E8